jgi:hypothetical protein
MRQLVLAGNGAEEHETRCISAGMPLLRRLESFTTDSRFTVQRQFGHCGRFRTHHCYNTSLGNLVVEWPLATTLLRSGAVDGQ